MGTDLISPRVIGLASLSRLLPSAPSPEVPLFVAPPREEPKLLPD